jgi:hypothetical protein
MTLTYTVEKNERHGDYRVHEFENGEWANSTDNNWDQVTAEQVKEAIQAGEIILEEAPDHYFELEDGDLPDDA